MDSRSRDLKMGGDLRYGVAAVLRQQAEEVIVAMGCL